MICVAYDFGMAISSVETSSVETSSVVTDTEPYLPAAMAENTGYLLARLGGISADAFGDALAPMGLRPRHYAVLSALRERGESATQYAIGGCLAIDPSTMVAVVDDLETHGLVRRRRDAADRRRYLLALTPKGRRQQERCRTAAQRVEAEVLSTLDEDQRAELYQLLRIALGQAVDSDRDDG